MICINRCFIFFVLSQNAGTPLAHSITISFIHIVGALNNGAGFVSSVSPGLISPEARRGYSNLTPTGLRSTVQLHRVAPANPFLPHLPIHYSSTFTLSGALNHGAGCVGRIIPPGLYSRLRRDYKDFAATRLVSASNVPLTSFGLVGHALAPNIPPFRDGVNPTCHSTIQSPPPERIQSGRPRLFCTVGQALGTG